MIFLLGQWLNFELFGITYLVYRENEILVEGTWRHHRLDMFSLAKLGDINPFCYTSPHNHGTQKWIPPVVVTFQIYPLSSMFHFHDYGKKKCVFVKKR